MRVQNRTSITLMMVGLLCMILSACGGQSSGKSDGGVTAIPTSPPTEAPLPTAIPTADTSSGIILVKLDGPTASLMIANPETGTFNKLAYFEPRDSSVGVDISIPRFNGDSPLVLRTLFSPDYSLVVASKGMSDGTRHVGWIDQRGVFTDISALKPTSTDFGPTESHDTPQFGSDGSFYFAAREPSDDWMKNDATVWKTTINDPSNITVATNRKFLNYFVLPDGSFGGPPSEATGEYAAGVALDVQVQDWIDDTNFVFVDDDPAMLFRGEVQSQGSDSGKPIKLIPETTRSVWSPVVSPDGMHVAFLSTLAQVTDVFIVSSSGGEPKKVVLNSGGSLTDLNLLDWI